MDWIEAGITFNIAIMSVNTLFLWSLHAKVTQLEVARKYCAFCQTDTSMIEVEKMKRCAEAAR